LREVIILTEQEALAHILAIRPEWLPEDIEIMRTTVLPGKPTNNVVIRLKHKGKNLKYSSRPVLVRDLD
jgi:hypothetical protein